jgi:hypothetical protein
VVCDHLEDALVARLFKEVDGVDGETVLVNFVYASLGDLVERILVSWDKWLGTRRSYRSRGIFLLGCRARC